MSQKLGVAMLVSRTNTNWGKDLTLNCVVRKIARISFSFDFMGWDVICLNFYLEGKGVRKLGVATTNIYLYKIFLLCYSSLLFLHGIRHPPSLLWGTKCLSRFQAQ